MLHAQITHLTPYHEISAAFLRKSLESLIKPLAIDDRICDDSFMNSTASYPTPHASRISIECDRNDEIASELRNMLNFDSINLPYDDQLKIPIMLRNMLELHLIEYNDQTYQFDPTMTHAINTHELIKLLELRMILIDMQRPYITRYSLEMPESRQRESLTQIALDYSLCPLHYCDYAICFDDDDAECASIRSIHPSHDT